MVPLVVLPIELPRPSESAATGARGWKSSSDLTDLMSQMFSGIRVIKAFKMEDAETQEFERVQRRVHAQDDEDGDRAGAERRDHRVRRRAASSASASSSARGTSCARRVEWTSSTRSRPLAVFIGGNYFAFLGVRKFIKGYSQLQESIPATDRILELLEQVPSLRDAPDAVALPRVERGIAFDARLLRLRRARRCCATCRSSCARARPSPSSAAAARASPRSSR